MPTSTATVSAPPGAGTDLPTDGQVGGSLPHGVDQVPLLRSALLAARAADRAIAQLLEALMELDEHQLAEAITGIPLEQWLAIVGRRTRSDRRMLLTACDALRRLPSLRDAFLTDATVSWAQTRTVALQVERLPRYLDDAIDDSLARTITACQGSDPDALTSAVSRALRSIELEASPTTESEPSTVDEPNFLAIQPRLDGSGGSLYGEFDGLSLATIDAALTPPPERLRDVHGPRGAAARGRADRLVDVCDATLAGAEASSPGAAADDTDQVGSGSRPQLLIRVELASLLDGSALPGELLTRFTGGRMWADANTVRRLVQERGADLRTIVLDDRGDVVGVGRLTRVPPAWLKDAILALHDTCSGPGCQHPARSSDLDHASPWHSDVPGKPGGRTDVDELAPLCRTHNRTKESAGWQVAQSADGSRDWHHPATGVRTTTRPATWQPPRGQSTEPPELARERPPAWDTGPSPPVTCRSSYRSARAHRSARASPDLTREHRPDWDAA